MGERGGRGAEHPRTAADDSISGSGSVGWHRTKYSSTAASVAAHVERLQCHRVGRVFGAGCVGRGIHPCMFVGTYASSLDIDAARAWSVPASTSPPVRPNGTDEAASGGHAWWDKSDRESDCKPNDQRAMKGREGGRDKDHGARRVVGRRVVGRRRGAHRETQGEMGEIIDQVKSVRVSTCRTCELLQL